MYMLIAYAWMKWNGIRVLSFWIRFLVKATEIFILTSQLIKCQTQNHLFFLQHSNWKTYILDLSISPFILSSQSITEFKWNTASFTIFRWQIFKCEYSFNCSSFSVGMFLSTKYKYVTVHCTLYIDCTVCIQRLIPNVNIR